MTDLLNRLRRLAKNLNNTLINPNRGGCCVIAAEVGAYLEQIVPVRIRVSNDHFDFMDEDDWEGCDYNNLNDLIDVLGPRAEDQFAWNENDVFFGHVIVEFDVDGRTYHMDTSGVRLAKKRDPSFGWLMYDGYLPVNVAKALADVPGNWNWKFDRRQIPAIKKMVRHAFAPLNVTPKAV